jgi:hypothetical protein
MQVDGFHGTNAPTVWSAPCFPPFFALLSVCTHCCSSCIVCDEDATAELTVKTVKYFKGIQETMTTLLKAPMTGYSGMVTPKPSVTPVLFPEAADSTAAAAGLLLPILLQSIV